MVHKFTPPHQKYTTFTYFICTCVTHSSGPKWGWKAVAFWASDILLHLWGVLIYSCRHILEFWCPWTHPVLPRAGGLEVQLLRCIWLTPFLVAVTKHKDSTLIVCRYCFWFFSQFIVRFGLGQTKKGLVGEGVAQWWSTCLAEQGPGFYPSDARNK